MTMHISSKNCALSLAIQEHRAREVRLALLGLTANRLSRQLLRRRWLATEALDPASKLAPRASITDDTGTLYPA
jgi:hypothetical protein